MDNNLKMISLDDEVYMSIKSMEFFCESMIDRLASMSQELDLSDEFLNGMEFFKERLVERSESFGIDVQLHDLGIKSGSIRKII